MELDKKKKIIIAVTAVVLITILFIVYMLSENNNNQMEFEELISENNSAEIKETDMKENNTTGAENIDQEDITMGNAMLENGNDNVIKIYIHITGEVKKPGVVQLNLGDRIIDAIEKAGGETKQADLSQVNLAYKVEDGQKIYIPNKNEKISEYIWSGNGDNNGDSNLNNKEQKEENKVNINTASQSELDGLPGIGPALAQRIIDFRKENGEFKSIEDIQNVKGIGNSKFEDIKEDICV